MRHNDGWAKPKQSREEIEEMLLPITGDEYTLLIASTLLTDKEMFRVAWMAMLDLDVERTTGRKPTRLRDQK